MTDLSSGDWTYTDLISELVPDVHIGPPVAEALIPLNVHRWPGHALATRALDDFGLESSVGVKPIENLECCLEYLSSSATDAMYNERFIQVLHDTAVVNIATEVVGVPGAMFAADFANHQADWYIQELINAQISPSFDDEVYKTIRLKLRGSNTKDLIAQNATSAAPFNGIGVAKEYLDPGQRRNPLTSFFNGQTKRPTWAYKGFGQKKKFSRNGGSKANNIPPGGAQILIKVSIRTHIVQYVHGIFPSKLGFYFCSYSCKFFTLYSRFFMALFILKEIKSYANKINVNVSCKVAAEHIVSYHSKQIKQCRANRKSCLF